MRDTVLPVNCGLRRRSAAEAKFVAAHAPPFTARGVMTTIRIEKLIILARSMPVQLLVRYGVIPDIGRFACDLDPAPTRGEQVVIQTPRGMELGTVLAAERGRPAAVVADTSAAAAGTPNDSVPDADTSQRVLQPATAEDSARAAALRDQARREFDDWRQRLADWQLQLELLDLEWMLDERKLVLYVLGGRGPETTRLALLTAAAGLTAVEVQPVGSEGLIPVARSSGGCGSGGCGCAD